MSPSPTKSPTKRRGNRTTGRHRRLAALANYLLLGRIGSGAMGTVYLATRRDDIKLDELYAVKVLHAHLAKEPAFVRLLLDEARVARGLSHPNVIGICDAGELKGRHFVVMPYVEGGTLDELLDRARASDPDDEVGRSDRRAGSEWSVGAQELPVGFAASVVRDTLTGLDAAHTMIDEAGRPLGLVHRDVCPRNVIVGTDGRARIIDFGVAKASTSVSVTAPGVVKGTIEFMSPEQTAGGKLDCRSDVFSAGAVLWTALTGRPLFQGDNAAHTVNRIINAEIPRPSALRPEIPPEIDAVCMRALERLPTRRYQTALDMANALDDATRRAGVATDEDAIGDLIALAFEPRIERRRRALVTLRDKLDEMSHGDDRAARRPRRPSRVTMPPPVPSLPSLAVIQQTGNTGKTGNTDAPAPPDDGALVDDAIALFDDAARAMETPMPAMPTTAPPPLPTATAATAAPPRQDPAPPALPDPPALRRSRPLAFYVALGLGVIALALALAVIARGL